MDYRLPGSSVHGISQARILERVAIASSRGPSQPGMEPIALQYAESNVSSGVFPGSYSAISAQLQHPLQREKLLLSETELTGLKNTPESFPWAPSRVKAS